MYMDRQTAREMAQSILWWERKCRQLWNLTFGRVFGKVSLEPVPELEE